MVASAFQDHRAEVKAASQYGALGTILWRLVTKTYCTRCVGRKYVLVHKKNSITKPMNHGVWPVEEVTRQS